MKRTALALGTLVLAFSLSACGSDKPDTVVVHDSAPVVETVPAGQQFVDGIHSVTHEFDGVPDEDLVAAGRETCSNIGTEGMDSAAVSLLTTEGASTEQAGVMLAASVRFLCPQYTDQFKAWVSDHSSSTTSA